MLVIENIYKSFKKQPVLDNISFKISKGQIVALLGPNGSGKSTLLKSVLNIVTPDKPSKILYNNEDLNENIHLKNNIGYMPQQLYLPNYLTVKEAIFWLDALKNINPVFKEEMIKDLYIEKYFHKRIYQLSKGMLQKLNLLQCFMYDHKLFFIDEPTAGLDPSISLYFKKLIKSRSKKRGASILMASHIMSEVEIIADKILIIKDSKKILDTSLKKLFATKKKKCSLEEILEDYWN